MIFTGKLKKFQKKSKKYYYLFDKPQFFSNSILTKDSICDKMCVYLRRFYDRNYTKRRSFKIN